MEIRVLVEQFYDKENTDFSEETINEKEEVIAVSELFRQLK